MDLATTVSTANPPSPNSFDTVGDFIDGSRAITASSSASPTLSFTSTLPRASMHAVEQGLQLLHRVALGGVGRVAAGLAMSSV